MSDQTAQSFFGALEPLAFDPDGEGLGFRHYDPGEMVQGRRMEEHLRFAICYWHTFVWDGSDPFGGRSFERPWFPDTSMDHARQKADAMFDMLRILRAPFFTFHDHDVRPEGASLKESHARLDEMRDYLGQKMEEGGQQLLWGTANLFSNRRYMAGASTNPDPDVFAYCASVVRKCLQVTHSLGGHNYVLWGGREGYETLLNTDLSRELDQMGRFLSMLVDYKHKIGFDGTILIEPKPQEPTKHQYDFDVATVYGFLQRYGLENDVKVNIEQGHAILAGHSFEHEIALASALGIFGSIDMNRNDYQSGWDTDQFPNNMPEVALAYYEIIKAGGFSTGGTNFDAKVRRQSLDPYDLLASHAGAMDVCARAFKAAAAMYEDGKLEAERAARYRGWNDAHARTFLEEDATFDAVADYAETHALSPQPVSGRQEHLENLVNRYV